MKKLVEKVACVIMVAILLWVSLSTIEVMAKNMDKEPEYNPCNMWVITMDMCR